MRHLISCYQIEGLQNCFYGELGRLFLYNRHHKYYLTGLRISAVALSSHYGIQYDIERTERTPVEHHSKALFVYTIKGFMIHGLLLKVAL